MKFIVALCLLFALIHAKPVSDETDEGKSVEDLYNDEGQELDKTTQKTLIKVKLSDMIKGKDTVATTEPTTEADLDDDDLSKEEVAENSKETSKETPTTTTEEPTSTTPKNSAHSLTNSHLMTAVSILLVIFTIKF